MSALVDELRAGIPAYDVTQDGVELHDIDAAETLMSAAAAELTTLQSRLEAVKAERDAARELLTGEQQALDRTIDSYQSEYRKREAAEARVEELQKALMDIAYMNRSRDQLQDMARAILQKEPSDGNKS
jgi:chromosome segregation ATPase